MNDEKASQVIQAERSSLENINQIAGDLNVTVNVIADADAERLKQKLTSTHEQHWQEEHERFRAKVNAGYADSVREPVTETIAEINAYEEEEAPVNAELKARYYRLAAAIHLPHQTGGDADRCAEFLTQARDLSEGDGLTQCQITQALLLYETGDTQAALDILNDLTGDEAIRLRFAIYVETGRTDECYQMIESGTVDPEWCRTNADWTRAFLGYYTLTSQRQDVEDTLALLINQAPNADNYRVAAQSLVRLALAPMHEFCLAHDVFPNLHIGLELDELVDMPTQVRAASLFAQSAQIYRQHNCERDAVRMLTAAILLSKEIEHKDGDFAAWAAQLVELDPDNPVLIELRRPELKLSEVVGEPPTILDLHPLLSDPDAEPLYILRVATIVSDTPSRAAEVASILEQHIERFRTADVPFAHFVYVVLELWRAGGDNERALAWLEQTTSFFSHPRLEPLYYILFHWNRDDFESAKIWLDRALDTAPGHPEVLAAAVRVYHQLGDHQKKLEYAQSLFEILRTTQVADWYLSALWSTYRFETFLEGLDSVSDLPFQEQDTRMRRARALINLNRAPTAREDLEWLRDNNFADAPDLIALAWVYQLLAELDRAIAVLRDCVDRFPDEADAYLYLSHTYLIAGRRGECFEWALKARQEFPDDPRVLFHLWYFSHPTGQELHPQVGEAFRAFMPGGRFAEQSPFTPFTLEEILEWARLRREDGPDPTVLYRAGKASWMMLCMTRNVPVFLAHRQANQVREPRYVADGEQLQDIARLAQDHPRQVVLDYSALLTLWSLFDDKILTFLARYFDRVWLPDKLRAILLDEQDRIATTGQLAIYQAQCLVRDALSQWNDKITVHPRVDPEEGWDVIGHYTERTVTERDGLVHLNEHVPSNEPKPDVPTVGIAVLADLLHQVGTIDLMAVQTLKRHAKPSTQDEAALKSQLEEKREVVADTSTLVTWATSCDLNPLLDYFEHIHVSEPGLMRLQAEISGYEFRQQASESLQTLRRLLRQGEQDGLIAFGTISDENRVMRRLIEQQQAVKESEQDITDGFYAYEQLLFDYLDELLGIACEQDIPIWTDDRWIRWFRHEHCQPRYCFATDSFLAFAHQHPETAEPLSLEQYHTYYDQLVACGYYFLPISFDHILWHIRQGREVDSGPMAALLQHYRSSLIAFWNLLKEQEGGDEQLGVQVLGLYEQQLMTLLHKLHESDISLETSSGIFSALDLARQASTPLFGREPFFFTSLLAHIITTGFILEEDADGSQAPSEEVLEHCRWLHQVFLGSGVAWELVEEAWYQLVRYPLAMLDEAQTDLNRHIARSLMGQTLYVMPVKVLEYLLSTDIGPRLQELPGLQLQEQVYFQFGNEAEGEVEIRLPTQVWQSDYNQALTNYLSEPSTTTLSVGSVTLRVRPVAPGSVFLIVEEIPTEIYERYPSARGVRRYVCLLPSFTSPSVSHREALWRIGLEALQQHQISTDDWYSKKEELLLADDVGIQAGVQACRYLFGIWPVTKDYLAQSAQLGPDSIRHLLAFVEPVVIREWLNMPALDWSSAEDLTQWANQFLVPRISDQNQTGLVDSLDRLGRSIFPDAPIIRQRILAMLDSVSSDSERHDQINQLLILAETQSSLVLKANVALLLYEWLYGVNKDLPTDAEFGSNVTERILSLIVRVLQGRSPGNTHQAVITALETIMCRWLYFVWLYEPLYEGFTINELAYSASVGASRITDALTVEGQISQEVAQEIIDDLNSRLKPWLIASGVEPQPDGFFRPAWSNDLNYAASYLLKGLISDALPSPDFHSEPAIKAAALACGVQHRREQAFCSPTLPDLSWLDAELVADIGLASAAILGQPSESELETWPEEERNHFRFASIPDFATDLIDMIVAAIPESDEEKEIMRWILELFRGRTQPSVPWFELLERLLDEGVMNKLRQFEMCYGEMMWRLGDLVLHPSENCPPELFALINELVFEVPVGENAPALIEIKAGVLSQLVGFELDVESVCKWLQDLAQDDTFEVTVVRSALRPFILLWPHYSEKVREPLFDTLMRIARQPNYQNLWEFVRLARHQHVISTSEAVGDQDSA